MDLDLVRHALAAARKNGYAEVELGEGEATFTARLARAPKPKAAVTPPADTPAPSSASSEVKATLVGYYREGKSPLAVGQKIKKGDIVGTIEALGIATDLVSKVDGEVIELLVEPGQSVEYGQALAKVQS